MSKSKSRQPSRQASAASKPVSSSGSLATRTVSKPLNAVAEADAEESSTQDADTSTDAEVIVNKTATKPAEEGTKKAEGAKAARTATTVPVTPGKGSLTTKSAAKALPNTPRPVPNTPVATSSRAQSRDAAKYERRQAERQQRYLATRRRRRNRILIALSAILAVAVVSLGVWYAITQSSTANKPAAQGSFQETIYNPTYPPIDSVYCDQLEGSVEHIHALVSITINGQPSPIPQYLGIPQDSNGSSSCYYWLHTHDTTGVIHIESPVNEVFTFGQLRDEWDQEFQSLGFAPELLLNTGWKIWVNGKVYNGSLTSVPLAAHNIVTLAYNSPGVKPVTTYNWGTL